MSLNSIVLGMGISGEAAAVMLVRQGCSVTIVDGSDVAVDRLDYMRTFGVRVLVSVVELPDDDFDLCVVSPGIDQKSLWVVEMERRGVEVISELELGSRYCLCPMIAVTGTNGKSTLVKLLHDIFTTAGVASEIAGNYGIPLCDVAERSGSLDWIVVEVSSFQLEKVSSFRPKVGVLLNVQPDHLNRHGDMGVYRELKSRLFRCMGKGDLGIVHLDEMDAVRSLVSGDNGWVSFGESDKSDVYYDPNGTIVFGKTGDSGETVDISDSDFDNSILGQSAAAAVAVMQDCGVSLKVVSDAIKSFDPLSHRMQRVVVIDGVTFINDSKATNLAALKAGVEMTSGPVRLIAGGQLKEKNVIFVKEVLANIAVCVYVIGDAAKKLERDWRDIVDCVHCGDLETAVRRAWADARSGDTVLLSPGCASFDQFKSYNDRGEKFITFVEKINEEKRDENIVFD